MVGSRDDLVLVSGGSILGRARVGLLALTSTPNLWWFKPNPNTRKSPTASVNSGNADKSAVGLQSCRDRRRRARRTTVAETAQTARTSKASMKWASDRSPAVSREAAPTAETALCPRHRAKQGQGASGPRRHDDLRNVMTSTSRYAGWLGFSGSTGVTP